MSITKKDLKELGFTKNRVTPEESGHDKTFIYYTYDIGTTCLITCADDECVDGNYTVELFNAEGTSKIKDRSVLVTLIQILETGAISPIVS